MSLSVDFIIASGATVSSVQVIPNGFRLASLEVPAIDNAVLTIDLSRDGTTFRPPHDAGASLAQVQAASTGNRFIALGELLSRMTEGQAVRLTAGAAQTAQRIIRGNCVRTEA